MTVRVSQAVRWRARSLGRGAVRLLRYARRSLARLDRCDILRTLRDFGELHSTSLMVHSSLSACGHVCGGPEAVVGALRDWAAGRALVMPTHTYCYPEGTGDAPLFDIRHTPSLVGAVTEYYWRLPGSERSLHPTHSLACSLPFGEGLCRGHEETETPCGKGAPYERLVEQDCSVLMFGATMNTYTLFHTAEDAAGVPYLYERDRLVLRIRDIHGQVRPVPMRRQDMTIPRRFESMANWLGERGLLTRRKLGLGELLFIPSANAVHQIIVKEMRRDPLFLVQEGWHGRPLVRTCGDLPIN